MDDKRKLELALGMLNQMKAEVEGEIREVLDELRSEAGVKAIKSSSGIKPVRVERRPKTAAERKRQSEKMKAYWTKRRMQTTNAAAVIKSAPAIAKRRPKTPAEKKALSLKLKQAWARRKAQVEKKA